MRDMVYNQGLREIPLWTTIINEDNVSQHPGTGITSFVVFPWVHNYFKTSDNASSSEYDDRSW